MRATTVEDETLLLQRRALPKFHEIDDPSTRVRLPVKEDPNASDLVSFCELHSSLMEV